MKDLVFSIDLGTMGVKCSLVDFEAKVHMVAYREYPILSSVPGQAEQQPSRWWDGIVSACAEMEEKSPGMLSRVAAIGICGQMHTHVYLDQSDVPMGNALTWMDQRSEGVIREWKQAGVEKELFEETWNAPTTTYTAPQIIWTRANRPEVYAKTRSVLLAKDFVKFLLTGNKVTDPSDASGTALYDVRNKRWSSRAFELAGIDPKWFPPVQPSAQVMGSLTAQAAKQLGMAQGTPVVNGGSDHAVAEIGSGMLVSGTVSCILGTAGVVAGCVQEPVKDRKKRVMCWAYPLEGYWDMLGVTQTAASSLTWFRNTFDPKADEKVFEDYSQQAATVEPGSEGLVFLPYLMGERTPHWNPQARGVFFGMQMKHTRAHFVRAIMEGVAFSLKECLDVMVEGGLEFDSLCLMGGGSKSETWSRILADTLQRTVKTLQNADPGSTGNLVLSLLALGELHDPTEASKWIGFDKSQAPHPERFAPYEKNFQTYKSIYRQTREFMGDTKEEQ